MEIRKYIIESLDTPNEVMELWLNNVLNIDPVIQNERRDLLKYLVSNELDIPDLKIRKHLVLKVITNELKAKIFTQQSVLGIYFALLGLRSNSMNGALMPEDKYLEFIAILELNLHNSLLDLGLRSEAANGNIYYLKADASEEDRIHL